MPDCKVPVRDRQESVFVSAARKPGHPADFDLDGVVIVKKSAFFSMNRIAFFHQLP
jgi:hypothetical protein